MENIGLVLEGGGIRGVYTSGILDYFLEKNLEFKYIIGVSAGAIYSASYISKQEKRNLNIFMKYITDERYMGFKHFFKTGNYINLDFAYTKMTYELEPFSYEEFVKNDVVYKIGAFNCETGKTDFFEKKNIKNEEELLKDLMASGCLPFLLKETIINNKVYLDGGIASPIPIYTSILDGNEYNVIILTEPKGYKKYPLKARSLIKIYYKKYPAVSKALLNRHIVYNRTLKNIEKLEKIGKAFVFRPSSEVGVGRLEKDTEKIKRLYNLGRKDAEKNYEKLIFWLNSCKNLYKTIDKI